MRNMRERYKQTNDPASFLRNAAEEMRDPTNEYNDVLTCYYLCKSSLYVDDRGDMIKKELDKPHTSFGIRILNSHLSEKTTLNSIANCDDRLCDKNPLHVKVYIIEFRILYFFEQTKWLCENIEQWMDLNLLIEEAKECLLSYEVLNTIEDAFLNLICLAKNQKDIDYIVQSIPKSIYKLIEEKLPHDRKGFIWKEPVYLKEEEMEEWIIYSDDSYDDSY